MPSQRRMSAGPERGDSGGRMQRALDLPCVTVAAVHGARFGVPRCRTRSATFPVPLTLASRGADILRPLFEHFFIFSVKFN